VRPGERLPGARARLAHFHGVCLQVQSPGDDQEDQGSEYGEVDSRRVCHAQGPQLDGAPDCVKHDSDAERDPEEQGEEGGDPLVERQREDEVADVPVVERVVHAEALSVSPQQEDLPRAHRPSADRQCDVRACNGRDDRHAPTQGNGRVGSYRPHIRNEEDHRHTADRAAEHELRELHAYVDVGVAHLLEPERVCDPRRQQEKSNDRHADQNQDEHGPHPRFPKCPRAPGQSPE
jgi:hypothetical protein